MELDVELLAIVLSHMRHEPEPAYALRFTSRAWNDAWLMAQQWSMEAADYDCCRQPWSIVEWAARHDRVELAKWAVANGCRLPVGTVPQWCQRVWMAAMAHAGPGFLDWLETCHVPLKQRIAAVQEALERGDPAVLRWIRDHLGDALREATKAYLDRKDVAELYEIKISTIEFLMMEHASMWTASRYKVEERSHPWNNRCSTFEGLLGCAVRMGRWDLVEVMLGKSLARYEPGLDLMMLPAVASKSIDNVYHLIERGWPLSGLAMSVAVSAGADLTMIRWMHENGFRSTDPPTTLKSAKNQGDLIFREAYLVSGSLVSEAAKMGRQDVIRWALARGYSIPSDALRCAAKGGQIEVFQLLESKGATARGNGDVLLEAVREGRVAMVDWLYSVRGCGWMPMYSEMILHNRHHRLMMWQVDKGLFQRSPNGELLISNNLKYFHDNAPDEYVQWAIARAHRRVLRSLLLKAATEYNLPRLKLLFAYTDDGLNMQLVNAAINNSMVILKWLLEEKLVGLLPDNIRNAAEKGETRVLKYFHSLDSNLFRSLRIRSSSSRRQLQLCVEVQELLRQYECVQ